MNMKKELILFFPLGLNFLCQHFLELRKKEIKSKKEYFLNSSILPTVNSAKVSFNGDILARCSSYPIRLKKP